MGTGVIEWYTAGAWEVSMRFFGVGVEDYLLELLTHPDTCQATRRYREGKRAVMLWPEERMGEVVEL